MARFGSARVRGPGIPEAFEAIPMRGSRVEPRLAVLRPLSARGRKHALDAEQRRERVSSLRMALPARAPDRSIGP